MIELKIEQPAAIAFAEEEVKRAAAGNAQVLSDLRARLPGLGLEVPRWARSPANLVLVILE